MSAEPAVESHIIEHRKSFVSLRWLLIILGSYLTLFQRAGSSSFNWVFGFILLFAATNVAWGWMNPRLFDGKRAQLAINVTDVLFVSGIFFLLRAPNTY